MAALATLALALTYGVSAFRPSTAGGLQDLAAFPKYEVVFLNDRPLAASDAARCREEGLLTDEDFVQLRPRSRATIDDSSANGAESGSTDITPLELVTMHFTHAGTVGAHPYLCALPSANVTAAQMQNATQQDEEPMDPAASWLALSHLDGKCLYARHGWFTYSYCHNNKIRQFREAPQASPAPPEGWTPKEDHSYHGYYLGHAQPRKRKGSRKDESALVPEQTATFGVGPASRYLVQRWTDGTKCDKTGKPREVEVQVHCSMTSGDAIDMVKEVETCKYVVVINSPHLCSLPGFRPQTANDVDPAPIRCREVVTDDEFAQWEKEPRDVTHVQPNLLLLPDKGERQGERKGERKGDKKVKSEEKGAKGAFALDLDDEKMKRLRNIIKAAYGEAVPDDDEYTGIVFAGELSPKEVEETEEEQQLPIGAAREEDPRARLEVLRTMIEMALAQEDGKALAEPADFKDREGTESETEPEIEAETETEDAPHRDEL